MLLGLSHCVHVQMRILDLRNGSGLLGDNKGIEMQKLKPFNIRTPEDKVVLYLICSHIQQTIKTNYHYFSVCVWTPLQILTQLLVAYSQLYL